MRRRALCPLHPPGARAHLPLPNVPEGGGRPLRGSRAGAPRRLRLDARRAESIPELVGGRPRLLRRLRNALTFHYLDSEWIDVTIGSLDRPGEVPPRQQYGIESRMPWFDDLAALPATTTSESMERDRQARLINHQHPDHDTPPDWRPGGS